MLTLEELLKPVKIVDQTILRQYTRLTNRWEEKERSRYMLSNWFNVPSFLIQFGFGNGAGFIPFFHGMNFSSDNIIKPYGKDFNIEEGSSRVEKRSSSLIMIDRLTRLPFFATGVGMVSVGLYGVVSGYYTRDNQSLSEGLTHIVDGISFFGVASSQYVKDSDPKLLDKKPLLKTAWDKVKDGYHHAKDKIKAKIPEPQPALEPIPVLHYDRY